jgi:hypothetical protein
MTPHSPAGEGGSLAKGAAIGAGCGLAGALAMAASAKVEQLATGRPDSYVPAKTLAHLLRLDDPDADDWGRNMAMHYASGAIAGAIRGVMSYANLRGPFASAMHVNVRLSFDQTLENVTGVGGPPWTQPRDELAIDLAQKGIFSLVTGLLADALIEPAATSTAYKPGMGRRLKGHA